MIIIQTGKVICENRPVALNNSFIKKKVKKSENYSSKNGAAT